MKALKGFVCLMLCTLFSITAYADKYDGIEKKYKYNQLSPEIISSDGKYLYAIDEKTGKAYFRGSLEKNITVLEIPDNIDGQNIEGIASTKIESNNLVRVIIDGNIKSMLNGSFPSKSNDNHYLPVCTMTVGKGFEAIGFYAYRDDYKYPAMLIQLKAFVLPKTLKFLGRNSLEIATIQNLIIQSDSFISPGAIGFNYCEDSDFVKENYHNVQEYYDTACNLYFSGSIDNYDYPWIGYSNQYYDAEADIGEPFIKSSGLRVFKKPDANGFEKFEEAGYTVKEYTNEWWKDIKEIDSVTLSGAGLNENKTVTQKLSDSELKWMDKEYSLQMTSGEKVKLNSTFAPSDAFDDRMFFVSLNEDVVKVDVDSGEVTALKKGAATVRCVAASGVFSDVVVYVDGATAADLPDHSVPAATAANTNKTADTTKSAPNTTKTSEPAKGSKVTPIYIAVPAAVVAAALTAAVVIKKRRH